MQKPPHSGETPIELDLTPEKRDAINRIAQNFNISFDEAVDLIYREGERDVWISQMQGKTLLPDLGRTRH